MFKNLGGGLGALGDMSKMLSRAQELQQQMAELQERLETLEVDGEAGAGLVKATCTAKGALRRVDVDDSLLAVEEKQTLQDLIVAAVEAAQERGRERAQEEMRAMAEQLGLPPGMIPPGL